METKKTKIIGIVALVALALTVVTATYAYFQAQVGDPAAVDISVNAHTVDTFTFASGDPISISLDQENFATGKGNQVGSTTASATLTANNKTNTATEHYYLYLSIPENTYTYSIDENTPEIILTVTDSSGSAVEISGLTSVTATGANGTSVTGYDITNKSGLITILNNREITTTSSTTEKWNITITFINYDKDQSDNAGKSMSAKVIIQKEKITLLSDYVKAQYTGTQGENNIYFHNGTITSDDGTILDAQDNSYRYAGASSSVNNYVCFGSDEATCPTDNLYRIIGVFGDQVKLIKADYANSNLLGAYGDYYGSTTPNSSYYKGSMSSVNTYYWNYKNANSAVNLWSTSLLNRLNLNTFFYNTFSDTWKAKIATTTWKVGGNTYANIASVVAKTAYQNEITSPNPTSTSSTGETEYPNEKTDSSILTKIGLMYVSDYGFAASPSAWSTALSSYNSSSVTAVNWMYMGVHEWTISRDADSSNDAFLVYAYGSVSSNYVSDDDAVRPVFYLESSATYSRGDGTSGNPYRLG